MRETKVRSRTLVRKDGEELHLRYTIVEEQGTYGVRVEKADGECAELRDITASRERIEALFRMIWRGGVTPLSLRDIIEDWL